MKVQETQKLSLRDQLAAKRRVREGFKDVKPLESEREVLKAESDSVQALSNEIYTANLGRIEKLKSGETKLSVAAKKVLALTDIANLISD